VAAAVAKIRWVRIHVLPPRHLFGWLSYQLFEREQLIQLPILSDSRFHLADTPAPLWSAVFSRSSSVS